MAGNTDFPLTISPELKAVFISMRVMAYSTDAEGYRAMDMSSFRPHTSLDKMTAITKSCILAYCDGNQPHILFCFMAGLTHKVGCRAVLPAGFLKNSFMTAIAGRRKFAIGRSLDNLIFWNRFYIMAGETFLFHNAFPVVKIY